MSHYFTDYVSSIRSFSRNARLYLVSMVIAGLCNSFFFVLYNLYLKKMGFGPELPGLLISLSSLAAGLLALPAGRLSDLLGSRRLLLIASLLAMPFTLGRVLATGRTGLIVYNFLSGTAAAMAMVAQSPFLSDNSTPSERTHLFSLSMALNVATGFAGSYIAGALPGFSAHLLGWNPEGVPAYRLTMVIGALLFVLSVLPIAMMRDDQKHIMARTDTGKRQPIPQASWDTILWFGFTQLLIGFGAGMFVPFMNLYMVDVLKLSTPVIGTWFAFSSLTQAAGMLVAPHLSGTIGKIRTIVACQAASIPFVIVLALSPWPWLSIPAFLFRTMLMNMNGGVFNALAMEAVETSARGVMSGVLSLVFEGGWVVGPWLGGLMIQHYGYRPIFLAGALLYTVSTIIFWQRFRRLEERLTAAAAGPGVEA